MLPRSYTYFLLGILAYWIVGAMLYGPRRGDFELGKEAHSDAAHWDEDRYTEEGLARLRRGRWMRWLGLVYILLLGQFTGAIRCFGQ